MDGIDEWISTGDAARMLGYSAGHFRVKFERLIPSRRLPGGYRKWLRVAVERLRDKAQALASAG